MGWGTRTEVLFLNDPKTQDAVLSLQGAEKLSESGAIDAETWKVILLG